MAAKVSYILAAATGVALLASPAFAQPAKPAAPSTNLSEKLDQSNGVIRPKEVDPAIEKPAPHTQDQNTLAPPTANPAAPQPK